jgi:hypothetical protein
MTYRDALDSDIPAMLRRAEALHRLRGFPFSFDKGRVAAGLAGLIRSPDGLCLVADDGFLAAARQQTATSRETVGMMHGWHGPEALLDAYEAWAPITQLCTRPGDAAGEARLRGRGYVPVETNWIRRA